MLERGHEFMHDHERGVMLVVMLVLVMLCCLPCLAWSGVPVGALDF